jgi:Transcriptional regulators
VSRVTVRRAIDELGREGLLRKEQGRGTYVHSPEITQPLNTLIGVTETMQSMGLVPEDLDVSLAIEPVPESIGALLRLERGRDVWHLIRLRASEGLPICLIDNYIVPEHVPGLSLEILLQSLYATYERYFGLSLERSEELVEAKAATEIAAVRLQVRRGTPILVVTRTTYLENGEPLEVAVVRSRSDRYRYAITLTGRPNQSREQGWPHQTG